VPLSNAWVGCPLPAVQPKESCLTSPAHHAVLRPASVANYIGGSLHRLVAARQQHPDRAGQKRYFAERRLGIPLSSSSVATAGGGRAVERERKRAEISLGFAAGREPANVVTARQGQHKRAADDDKPFNRVERQEHRNEDVSSSSAALDEGVERPAKKPRTSAMLKAMDDDPGPLTATKAFPPSRPAGPPSDAGLPWILLVLSLDLHRRRLLAEDDWAGLDIKVDPLPTRAAPSRAGLQEIKGVYQCSDEIVRISGLTLSSRTMYVQDLPRPRALDRSVVNNPSSDPAASSRSSAPLPQPKDELDSTPDARATSSSTGEPLPANDMPLAFPSPAARVNLERPASPLQTSYRRKTRTILADNPRSIFYKAPDATRSDQGDAPPSPSAHSIATTHSPGSASTAARQTPARENVSVTEQILAGREPLRAGLATLALGFPTDRRGVARPRTGDGRSDGDVAAPGPQPTPSHDRKDNEPPELPILQNPFIYLAKSLGLRDLVGSSSDDG
jgi:hypothetical protein